MNRATDVAIIGAGPFGLSIAAHLRDYRIESRIFGIPLHRWREQMPDGMSLKSEGFASDLYDPSGRLTLRRFCNEKGIPYADVGTPVPRSTFAAYGMDFQKQLVPDLEAKAVTVLERQDGGFSLRLSDGEVATARRVIVATGMSYFEHIPPSLAHLPQELLTHSADHFDLSRFQGRDVTVIGGGASALDLAAELKELGAQVRLVARRSSVVFNPHAEPDRSLWKQMRYPVSGIGFGLRARFYADAPAAFHYLPETVRLQIVRTFLGPSGGFYLRDRILGHVPLMLGFSLAGANACPDGITLTLLHEGGRVENITTGHVIAATGYKVDLGRLPFISDRMRTQIRSVEGAPILSANFESSIRGLHFVGLASANSFGPVMRFMFGAGYTARRLTKHLARSAVVAA